MKEKCGRICIYQKKVVILPRILINVCHNPNKKTWTNEKDYWQ